MTPGEIQSLAKQYFEHTRDLRRELHKHPELAFEEYQTAATITKELDALGIPYETGIAKTGVVALIKGAGQGRTIALRADMDALPIQEENTHDYKSQNDGVMHACGHDVHTSCLLGAARILQEKKKEWNGNVKLIFQPSEEKLPGGASIMIQEGVLQNPPVEAIFGQHVYTPFDVGTVAFCSGKMMASTDELYIRVIGKGGHGAYPETTKDPVPVAAQIISALQLLISRHKTAMQPAVLTIGKIIADGATNVIPDEVYMEGTVRSLDEGIREQLLKDIETTVHGMAAAFGQKVHLDIRRGYPSLQNDSALTEQAILHAREYLGDDKVLMTEPRMGGEDFAFYSQKIPACFYRLGTGNKSKNIVSFIHSPSFDIDEDALLVGTGLMAWQAIRKLQAS